MSPRTATPAYRLPVSVVKKNVFLEALGARIARARADNGLTLHELAKRLGGISVGYLSEIEHGKKTCPPYTLYRIEKALGEVHLWP